MDVWGVGRNLDDIDFLTSLLLRAAEEAGASVVGMVTHRYTPQGVSIVLLVAESHISIHTWPEEDYAAVDVYTCGGTDAGRAVKFIVDELNPRRFTIRKVVRGVWKGV